MWHDYPYTDLNELNLDWFLKTFKELVEEWNQVKGEWNDLHSYVENYFDNLNVQNEIDNKMDALVADGTLATIMEPYIDLALPSVVDGKLPAVVAAQISAVVAAQISAVVAAQIPGAVAGEAANWLAAHVDPDTGYVIDDTLTIQGAAADAKKVGDICLNAGNDMNIHQGGLDAGTLTDCNSAVNNRIYAIFMQGDAKNDIANLPADAPLDGYIWYLITIDHLNGNTHTDDKVQIFYKYNMSVSYFRQKSNNSWTNWGPYQRNFLRSDYTVNTQVAGYDTGDLTDLNNVKLSSIYAIQMAGTIKTKIANIPADAPLDGTVWYLMTYGYRNTSNHLSYLQLFYNANHTYIYRRQFDESTWYNWRRILDISSVQRVIIVDPAGNGDFTKLTDALADAYSKGNTDIYVKNGTYDITSEIDLESAGSGPTIGKNTRVFFDSRAFVTCHYTGSGSPRNTFAVFNAGTGDFELHNLKINCSKIRYCVHDERGTNTDPYRHRYINCQMILDNSNNGWDSPQCIGGGLGVNGIIEIDGGYYEGLPHAGDNNYGEISYHNSSASDAQSEIWIKNVYCKNNTVRFGYYGSSTAVTPCYVNGCSFAASPLVRAETSGSTVVNMKMTEWNNEIRS